MLLRRDGSAGGAGALSCLLGQHRLFVALVLLQPRQRLGRGIQLRVQAGQHIHVGALFAGQSAGVLLLEAGQLRVLIVQIALGVGQLRLQKVGGSLGGRGAVVEVLADEERRDLAADKLGGARDRWPGRR